MKSVMHIISGDLWAGAESQAYTFLKALHETKKYNLAVVIFNKGDLYHKLTDGGINVYLVDERINMFRMCWQVINLIHLIKPEIIHSHEYKSHILAVFAQMFTRNRARVIRTLHGLTNAPRGAKHLKSYIALRMDDFVLRHYTDCIIAVSHFIESTLNENYPNTLIWQINNAVEISKQHKKNELSAVRNRVGIPPETFWIATAARLVPVKNIEMLIDAANVLVNEKHLGFIMSIFGNGPLKNELESKIERCGLNKVVRLHGHVSNMSEIMGALDVFVLTSRSEGLPMSLLEAMSSGIIPVCTNVGGMVEVIEDQKSGFLVKEDDHRKLAEILFSLCQKDEKYKENIRNNVRRRVEKEYSVTKSLEKLVCLYERQQ